MTSFVFYISLKFYYRFNTFTFLAPIGAIHHVVRKAGITITENAQAIRS